MAINQAQLRDLLTEYRAANWHGIQTPEWQQKIVSGMLQSGEPRLLKRIAPYHELPRDACILDLGSGVGNFVVACRKRGLRAFGIEPDRIGAGSSVTSLQIASKRLEQTTFAAAVGEALPLPDSTFDLVVLDQVIEHVSDQKKVLNEAFRVLKPTGCVYIACPNFLRFYEPHYKLWFVPLMPKPLACWYLRLRGRNPVLLQQLNYTTNWRVRKLLRKLSAGRLIDLNREDLRKRCESGAAVSRKGRLSHQLIRLPWIGEVFLKAALFYLRLAEGGSEILAFPAARNHLKI
jgi:ubiquinone/menaquinone biosynthesis C-methylase UbiE